MNRRTWAQLKAEAMQSGVGCWGIWTEGRGGREFCDCGTFDGTYEAANELTDVVPMYAAAKGTESVLFVALGTTGQKVHSLLMS